MASNTNPYGPCTASLSAIGETTPARYPERYAESLRLELAQAHGLDESQVVCAAGASAIIEMLFRMLPPSSAALWSNPSFILYEMCARQIGLAYRTVPHLGWFADLDAMADAVTSDIGLVLIANPNNPTGTFVHPSAIEGFLERVPRNLIVAIDEAYIEYAPSSCLPLLAHYENLVIVRTFSKAYGLAGMRVGYAVGNPGLIERLRRQFFPFHIAAPAVAAARAALADIEYVAEIVAQNDAERERVTGALRSLGLSIPPSEANFVFLPLSPKAKLRLSNASQHANLRLGDLAPYGLPHAVRVSLGTPEQNDLFLSLMTAAVARATPRPIVSDFSSMAFQ